MLPDLVLRLVHRFARLIAPVSVCLLATGAVAQNSSRQPADEPYSVSFAAGKRDARGNFLGGTEIMNLVPFQGKLYAGVGYWMDRPDYYGSSDPRSAAQVIVLDSKQGHWRQESIFDDQDDEGKFVHHRISAMEVLHFHQFDSEGNITGPLADVLAVGLDVPQGGVFTQKSPGHWENTHIPVDNPVRSLAVHFDRAAGVEKVYLGPGGGEDRDLDRAIYSGVYDPSAPGRIRWNPTPERTGIESRVMSMVDCGGSLYAAAKPSIFRRNDATGHWEAIYSYRITEDFDNTRYASGFRGLTCVDKPGSDGKKTLLSGFESVGGDIMNVDPDTGTATTELRSRRLLTEKWGSEPVKPDIIVGYNDAPQVSSNPDTRLFTVLARSPNGNEDNSAWFISRTADNPPAFALHQVKPLRWPNKRSDSALWSVRTVAVSPFPEDKGNVLYMGGYDGHFQPVHNTAWLYRVGINTALRPYDDVSR